MKKFIIMLAVLVLAGAGFLQASSTNTYTNVVGQVVTVITGDDGVITTTFTQPVVVSATARSRIAPLGAQISTSTTVAPTSFTPADIGDILIGTVSNVVYMSTGVTTNDWVQLSP